MGSSVGVGVTVGVGVAIPLMSSIACLSLASSQPVYEQTLSMSSSFSVIFSSAKSERSASVTSSR